jgi:hypothetical protein
VADALGAGYHGTLPAEEDVKAPPLRFVVEHGGWMLERIVTLCYLLLPRCISSKTHGASVRRFEPCLAPRRSQRRTGPHAARSQPQPQRRNPPGLDLGRRWERRSPYYAHLAVVFEMARWVGAYLRASRHSRAPAPLLRFQEMTALDEGAGAAEEDTSQVRHGVPTQYVVQAQQQLRRGAFVHPRVFPLWRRRPNQFAPARKVGLGPVHCAPHKQSSLNP